MPSLFFNYERNGGYSIEPRIFVTMVGLTYTAENGETLEINDYIFGRINGIKYSICDVPNGCKETGSTK